MENLCLFLTGRYHPYGQHVIPLLFIRFTGYFIGLYEERSNKTVNSVICTLEKACIRLRKFCVFSGKDNRINFERHFRNCNQPGTESRNVTLPLVQLGYGFFRIFCQFLCLNCHFLKKSGVLTLFTGDSHHLRAGIHQTFAFKQQTFHKAIYLFFDFIIDILARNLSGQLNGF